MCSWSGGNMACSADNSALALRQTRDPSGVIPRLSAVTGSSPR